ncbi:MAG: putative sensor domain DACNV-containing protein, partial [Mucilaginibacter sp.]
IRNSEAQIMTPGQDGGTRHFAAAQFVHDQRDAFAMVASQDGRFTIFSWSPCDGIVHAHRVDTLLL